MRSRFLPKASASTTNTPHALVDALAADLQSRVMTGEIPLGSWLRQEGLAAEFEVSRTPVREALRKLETLGLVQLVPNRGALVRGPTARVIREAYLVRAELEGLAAQLAVNQISDAQLERLRAAEDLFSRSVSDVAGRQQIDRDETEGLDVVWDRANTLFHGVVQEASGNEQLHKSIEDLHRVFPRNLTWAALSKNTRLLQRNVTQHRNIREAIENGDELKARNLMTHHVLDAGGLVATWFEQQASLIQAHDG